MHSCIVKYEYQSKMSKMQIVLEIVASIKLKASGE